MTLAPSKTCVGYGNHFIELESEAVCPQCHPDNEIYQKKRRKREPKQFLSYAELLAAWRNRRRECSGWRKLHEEVHAVIQKARQLEQENAALRLAVDTSAESLAAEVLKLRKDLEFERSFRQPTMDWDNTWSRLAAVISGKAITPDRLKRLKALCHPDRWHGMPQEQTATELSQWLNGLGQ